MALAQLPQASFAQVSLLIIGVFSVRSCGCVINDICDREFDAQVARTAKRPLAAGTLSVRWALMLVLLTGLLALMTVSWVPVRSYPLIMGSGALIVFYPLSKRFFPFPQAILGLAFASPIACITSFYQQPLDNIQWQLMATVFFWVISFDTAYALADFEDDNKLNIQSLPKTLGYRSALLLSQALLILCQMSITSLTHSHTLACLACALSWGLSCYLIALADTARHKQLVFHYHGLLGFLWALQLIPAPPL